MVTDESRAAAAAAKKAARKERELRWIIRGGSWLFKLLAHSWRIREHGRESSDAYRAGGRPVVFTVWHGEMLPLLWVQIGRASCRERV